MRYEAVFLNTFLKQFKKLPGNARQRQATHQAENPRARDEPLLGF